MKNLRRQLLINPPLQYKLLMLILLSMCVPVIILLFCTFTILNNIIAIAEPGSEIIFNAIKLSIHQLMWIIAIGLATLAALLLYWTSLFSNRIVGPIYRLEKELEEMISTDHIRKIHFRKNDAFLSLATKINHLLVTTSKSKENE